MRTYRQALDYLDRFISYERHRDAPYSPETLNLDRIRALLARLGDPQRAAPAIHVAGTKGKGSTCAMIDSILRSAGYRVGLYTSPNLHTFRERMRVHGRLIAPATVAALVDEMAPHIEAVPGITLFEIVTTIAFLHFARCAVDISVLEVGLGGRFDATNVITPLVSVIASLSLDHTAWLGDTLGQIAYEKAGIIKPGVPVACAPQPAEALEVIERVAADRRAPLTLIGRDVDYAPAIAPPAGEPAGAWFTCCGQTWHTALTGSHQVDNAVLAITAVRLAAQLRVGDEAIRRGLARVQWPGRFEIARRDPPLVFDGAHNVDSMRRLVDTLQATFPGRRWTAIFGASADKDIAGMLAILAAAADRIIATQARAARAADLQSIAASASGHAVPIDAATDVEEALQRALASGAAVVATGSLFVVAEAREAWFRHAGLPLPPRDR